MMVPEWLSNLAALHSMRVAPDMNTEDRSDGWVHLVCLKCGRARAEGSVSDSPVSTWVRWFEKRAPCPGCRT